MKHTLKVYKGSVLHAAYMEARFKDRNDNRSFKLEGHRWAYEHAAFDDDGDYDLLYRFTEDEPEAPDTTDLRDTFAAAALMGLCGNPGGPFQANDLNGWALVNCDANDLAIQSWTIADAMLKARNAT